MKSRCITVALLASCALAGAARSSTITTTLRFDIPELSITARGAVFTVAECRTIASPGDPMLPVYAACFILPPGERVSRVDAVPLERVPFAAGAAIAPMPPPARVGSDAPEIAPRSAAYGSPQPFPAAFGELASEQTIDGIRLAFVNVVPVEVVPATGAAVFFPAMLLTVTTEPGGAASRGGVRGGAARVIASLGRSVRNADLIREYDRLAASPSLSTSLPPVAQYAIITTASLAPAFEPLVELRSREGLRAEIVDVGWIYASFEGRDSQERIRTFVAYAHENWGTQYVLLGGDEEIIPHRGLYAKVGTEIETDIPSDLYYGALDGTWNTDGDAYWGEPGEEDLLAEVAIGRLPADSYDEAARAVAKIVAYELAPVASQCATAAMLGELLWDIDGVVTYGCDYKDEVRFGSSNYGFTTAGVPSFFETTTLYDRDLGFAWNLSNLLPILNAGVNLVNHCGHSNTLSVMRLAVSDVPLLTNDGVSASFFVCYSHGCYAAAFDNRDDAGTYLTQDAIGEELVTDSHGAAAFVGNSRSGWDAPGSTASASQFFDRAFFDALFGAGIVRLGDALAHARLRTVPFVPYAAVRWVYYEQTILGDPAMRVWTAHPSALVALHDSSIAPGQSSFAVEVQSAEGAVAGARVTLAEEASGCYASTVTDAAGAAFLAIDPPASGDLLLSVEAPNHYILCDTIPVASIPGPLPVLEGIAIQDDSTSSTAGNGNGILEAGETAAISFAVRNIGDETLRGANVAIQSRDPLIAVADSLSTLGDIAPGATASPEDALVIVASPAASGEREAGLLIEIRAGEGRWRIPHSLALNGPAAELVSWSATDAAEGNGNGCLEAREFISMQCAWRNTGAAEIRTPVVRLTCIDGQWGQLVRNSMTCDDISPLTTSNFNDSLMFLIKETTPPFSPIRLVLSIEGANLASRGETLQVRACGTSANFSGTVGEPLDHRSIIGPDEWHESSARFYSAPSSWKCGSPGSGAYANMMDAVLVLPPLCLYTGSSLTFRHRMNAEADAVSPYWAQDAGVVEISLNGGATWSILTPAAKYPARVSPYRTIVLPAYTRCFSGAFDWRYDTVDLSAYHGPVLIRFHFETNEQYGFEGWYIDDIQVTTLVPADAGDPPPSAVNALGAAYPNPFNPSTMIPIRTAARGHASLAVYDVAGRLVRTLVDGILDGGFRTVPWDGKDSRGGDVPSGVYFARLAAGTYTATTRLVIVR